MAENETLDLRHPNSRRWRHLCSLVRDRKPEQKIAEEAIDCLYQTWKRLSNLLPLRRLIDAASGDLGHFHRLVAECGRAREYAQLFQQQAGRGRSERQVVEAVLVATLHRFFDQIAIEAGGQEGGPDFNTIERIFERVEFLASQEIGHLANQIVENPHAPLKRPPKIRKLRKKENSDLIDISLLEN